MPADAHQHQPDETNGRPGEWDERYGSAEQVWSGQPNGALVAEVSGLPVGRALDVGCGEGADAVWLATHGWQVTGCDVSQVALDRARAAADAAGVTVRWLLSGLVDATSDGVEYDLVSVQYPALLRTPGRQAERALLSAVAAGGVLLVVHHADVDLELAKAHGFDPADYVGHEDVLAALGDGWRVDVDEVRPRGTVGGGGGHHKDDLLLLARRHGDGLNGD